MYTIGDYTNGDYTNGDYFDWDLTFKLPLSMILMLTRRLVSL